MKKLIMAQIYITTFKGYVHISNKFATTLQLYKHCYLFYPFPSQEKEVLAYDLFSTSAMKQISLQLLL